MYANTYNDLEKAKYWFQRASENGYKDVEEALKQIESTSNSNSVIRQINTNIIHSIMKVKNGSLKFYFLRLF